MREIPLIRTASPDTELEHKATWEQIAEEIRRGVGDGIDEFYKPASALEHSIIQKRINDSLVVQIRDTFQAVDTLGVTLSALPTHAVPNFDNPAPSDAGADEEEQRRENI